MIYYLLDASSYVRWALNKSDSFAIDFTAEKRKNNAFLYMPQFCVTEVMAAFSKEYYFKKLIDKPAFKKHVKEFSEAISQRSLIYIYDLHRYHNIVSEKSGIYIKANEIDSNIGVFDILIIAMAKELRDLYRNKADEIIILSEDAALRKTAQALEVKALSIKSGRC